MPAPLAPPPSARSRLRLGDEIGCGGMASVYLARRTDDGGFARTVAVKRMHPHVAKDPRFVSMFVDEARLALRINHPNVVTTLEVASVGGEPWLVMEYVHGEALHRLIAALAERGGRPSAAVASSIVCGLLEGLHGAHETSGEGGAPLGIVHRDVSPQNILVGADGVPRVLDFGVAKAIGRLQTTREGQLKGKLTYMAPELLEGAAADRRCDVYAAGVVLWECLTGHRLIEADHEVGAMRSILRGDHAPPSRHSAEISPSLDAVVLKAISLDPDQRFATAREFAAALEAAAPIVSSRTLAQWVEGVAGEALAARAALVASFERSATTGAEAASIRPAGLASPEATSEDGSAPMANGVDDAAGAVDAADVLDAGGAHGKALGRAEASARPFFEAMGDRAASSLLDETQASVTETWRPSTSSRPMRSEFGTSTGRRRAWALAAGGMVVVALVAGVAHFGRAGAREVASATGRDASTAPALSKASADAAAGERAGAASAGDDHAPAPPLDPSEPGAGEVTPSNAARDRHAAARGRGARGEGAARAKPTTAQCDPPYTIDARGVQRWKRECIGSR